MATQRAGNGAKPSAKPARPAAKPSAKPAAKPAAGGSADPQAEVTHTAVALEALAPHPRNYKQHPEAQIERIRASLRRYGQVRSIVCQEGAGGRYLIVAGHGLVEAARLEGFTQLRADVIPATWSQTQVEGYLISDNETARGGEDDLEQLASMLEEQRAAGEALESLGFSDDELQALLDELNENGAGGKREVDDPGGGGDDFDATPDESGPTRVQPGELWILGGYTVCPHCHAKNAIGGEGNPHGSAAH